MFHLKKERSLSQKSGYCAHPWGCLPLSHSVSLNLLPVVSKKKKGFAVTKVDSEIPLPPQVAYAPAPPPPSPKPNGPFSENFPINTISASNVSLCRRGPTGGGVWNNLQVSDQTRKITWFGRKETTACDPGTSEIPILSVKVEQSCKNQNHIAIMSHITTRNQHSGWYDMRVKPHCCRSNQIKQFKNTRSRYLLLFVSQSSVIGVRELRGMCLLGLLHTNTQHPIYINRHVNRSNSFAREDHRLFSVLYDNKLNIFGFGVGLNKMA